MDIAPDLADRLYTVLVETLGAPDDYRRWSFIYAITEGHVLNYSVDSQLGAVRFHNEECPIVVCLDRAANCQRITKHANALIREVTKKKPAKVIRPIRIRAVKARVKIPVVQVPSLETTAQQLSV